MTTATAEITYQVGTYYSETTSLHTWKISDDVGVASELYVDMDTYEIRAVETRSDRRGEGLATALYQAACAMYPVRHAAETHRTPEGSGWAASVGGDTAPCTDGCCTDIEE